MKKITLLYFPPSSDLNNGGKILGIKLLRSMTNMGLREAKDMIEDLQVNVSHDVFINEKNEAYLTEFVRLGGKYKTDNSLENSIRESINQALNQNQFDIAIKLIETLKTVN
jgi:hypothetical protein